MIQCLRRPRRRRRTLQPQHRQRTKRNRSRGGEDEYTAHYDSCFLVQPPDGPGTEGEDAFGYDNHAYHVEDCKRRVDNRTRAKLNMTNNATDRSPISLPAEVRTQIDSLFCQREEQPMSGSSSGRGCKCYPPVTVEIQTVSMKGRYRCKMYATFSTVHGAFQICSTSMSKERRKS
jgi:hypothetical protein